jgi:hypothetical protein
VFDDFNLEDILSQPFISDEDLAALNFDPSMFEELSPIMDQSGMFNLFDPTFQLPDILDSFDPSILNSLAGLGSGGNVLSRLLGGGGSGGGGGGLLGSLGGLSGLLGLGGTVLGGLNSRQATQDAQRRMDEAVTTANAKVEELLGGAQNAYKPYQEAGAGALAKLAAMQPSNLAAGFGPIGAASNIKPGAVGQPSNLAAKFRPLGR